MAGQDIQLHDTTLRDGARPAGRVLPVDDRLAVARCLDGLGVGFIEGGRPGAAADTEFFRRAAGELRLASAVLVARGVVRAPGASAATDPRTRELLAAGTPVVTLAAVSDSRRVERAPGTNLAENLAAVGGTVRHLVRAGRRVLLDAEHFFDGHRANREYALEVVRTAAEAGAETVVLCDGDGGRPADEVGAVVSDTLYGTGVELGVHCRGGAGRAVAGSVAAVAAGARQVRGTVSGYGWRRDADLLSVAAHLIVTRGAAVLSGGSAALGAAVAESAGRAVEVVSWQVGAESAGGDRSRSSASVLLRVDGVATAATASGGGAVEALDRAVHRALDPVLPGVRRLRLTGHLARVPAGHAGTAGTAGTARVVASFADGDGRLDTVGVAADTGAAFLRALLEAVRRLTARERHGGGRTADRGPSAAHGPTLTEPTLTGTD
ncbi:alpha-isopropylmalate synthase regulatory domain-containing protein [Streptomyces sp. NPDC101249]|uniref:alpha-isopropylmalate synthase regulatory domain-containing protein n=1 Tax=Streptomyces sp. NPDC101249 TaxID=3366140 RepID=UPI00382C30E3